MLEFFKYINSGFVPYFGTLCFLLAIILFLCFSILAVIVTVKIYKPEEKQEDVPTGKTIFISPEQANQLFRGLGKQCDGKTFH